jgi:hypothetical protein
LEAIKIVDNIPIPTEATLELEKKLLKTTWVKEAELIQTYVPEEDLNKTQQKLLEKCIAKEDFTDKQLADLKLLLNKYRLILQKLQPEETIENIDKVSELIQTEQDFLDLMDSDSEKYLKVNMPYKGKVIPFEFEVLPLVDSRVIDALELHIDIFKDFDFEEATTYSNALSKPESELTDDEKHIIEKLNELIADKLSVQRIEATDKFLANQLRIKDSDSDLETRLKFWSKFHFNAKFSVFVVVQNRLGLNEVSDEKLFPSGQ